MGLSQPRSLEEEQVRGGAQLMLVPQKLGEGPYRELGLRNSDLRGGDCEAYAGDVGKKLELTSRAVLLGTGSKQQGVNAFLLSILLVSWEELLLAGTNGNQSSKQQMWFRDPTPAPKS